VEPGEGAGGAGRGGLGVKEVPCPHLRLSLDSGVRQGQGPRRPLTKTRSREAVSAFPALLLLFGKEVATAVVPVALGHFSPLLPQCVYDSGVCFFFFLH